MNPHEHTDPINEKILTFAEDQISGFHERPFQVISEKCGLDESLVIERLKTMFEAGVVRRIRQTMITTKLVDGALIAWEVPDELLDQSFEFLKENDPYTGHIVLRTTDDPTIPGASFKLWTTLKVPQGKDVTAHCALIQKLIHASRYVALPAEGVFTLGVGHVRRRQLQPGDKDEPATMDSTEHVSLNAKEWDVLLCLKEQLTSDEFTSEPWIQRAKSLNMSPEEFYAIAHELDNKGVVGRFATFLEHSKPSAGGHHVTRHNGLFHWAVPVGMEEQAGSEIGRHLCMTHCYWRSGGAVFGDAQIMGVVHALNKETVLAHKEAIDRHLASVGIPLLYSAVFWGTRSEIKPSEISPIAYDAWFAETSKKA